MNTIELRETLHDRLDEAVVPPGDLDRIMGAGRARKRHRLAGVGAGVAAAGTAATVALLTLFGPGAVTASFASVGPLDYSDGLRAYADPGKTIHLGGRSFPAQKLEQLDTDAVATPYGMVFFDAGRPYLLDESGDSTPLVEGEVDDVEGFHPTAKADVGRSLGAWATLSDGTATITVRDMSTGDDVATSEVDCGTCGDLVIDGIDGGVVFVRTDDGIRTWDTATDEWEDFAGPRTEVADVRNGVVLYDGPAPTAEGWTLVRGAIDSQLTHDGTHVLAWSNRLEPVDPGGSPVVLDVAAPAKPGEYVDAFFTLDTDGSVLVAWAEKRYPNFTVYDCEIPSGSCAEVGPLRTTSGDPMFVGNDM
jgi:hypothetical protein